MGCGKSKTSTDDTAAGTEGGTVNKAATGAAGAASDKDPQDHQALTGTGNVVVVFGATGWQGGSVARALKADDRFTVRAVTRNPDSDKAKALADEGFEMVKADLDDAESLKQVLQGAYGVFLVTNYWDHMDKERELQQGKNVVDAARECNVRHIVYSGASLNTKEQDVDGQPPAKNIEAKIATRAYITEQEGLQFTVVQMATYYENLLGKLKMKKNDNHEYVLDIPMGDKPLDMLCVSEVGECIHQIFARPDEFKGQTFGLCSQRFTVEEYAAILSKAFDTKKFVAGTTSLEDYAKSGEPGAEEMAATYELFRAGKLDFDIEITRKLNPNISTFEQWVDNNRDELDSALASE